MTGNAILVDYITLGLAWRNGQILPHNVAPDIFRARFGLERNFCQPVHGGMTFITSQIRMHPHFLGSGSFLHQVT